MTNPTQTREILLQPGQRADVLASGAEAGYLQCVSGSAHLVTGRMGVGWLMHAGDGCMLRTPMRYRVLARTTVRLLLQSAQRAAQPSRHSR